MSILVPPDVGVVVSKEAPLCRRHREMLAALRTNPVSKRLVLENLILDLAAEPGKFVPAWRQEAFLD